MKNRKLIFLLLLHFLRLKTFGQCTNQSYASDFKTKEFYDLTFKKSFFEDYFLLNGQPIENYPAYPWNYKGNTYRVTSTFTGNNYKNAFGSLENGARLIESLLVM